MLLHVCAPPSDRRDSTTATAAYHRAVPSDNGRVHTGEVPWVERDACIGARIPQPARGSFFGAATCEGFSAPSARCTASKNISSGGARTPPCR